MPVSDASVQALKKYLSIFSDGDSVAAGNRNWQNSKNSWPILLSVLVRKV
ncbi:hypothetical protein ACLB1E_07455 [Escherichia coli]